MGSNSHKKKAAENRLSGLFLLKYYKTFASAIVISF